MTQLSRENLEEIKYRAETQGVNAGYLPGEILSMVDRLLAAEAQEPVAYMQRGKGIRFIHSGDLDAPFKLKTGNWTPLHAAPKEDK